MNLVENHEKLKQIRDGLPNVWKKIFTNTGTMGILSLAAIKAIENELVLLSDEKYIGKPFLRYSEINKQTRATLSRLINAEADELVITNSTTNGIYNTIFSINWSAGDEVLTTDKEHFAVNIPLLLIREKYGVDIKYFNINDDYATELQDKITARTKLIVASHVSFATGEVLPVKEIIRIAHDNNVPVLIDGAQSVGAIPVDVKELDVDYYSFPAQKWLNGPQGTGVLYVNKHIIDDYRPEVNNETNPYPYQDIKLPTNANRFVPAAPNAIVSAAFEASVGWLIESVGTDFAYQWIQELSRYLRASLAEVEGVTVVTPIDAAGITAFYTDFIDAKTLNDYLTLHDVLTRTVSPFEYVRVSVSYFNTKQEIDTLVRLIKAAKKEKEEQHFE